MDTKKEDESEGAIGPSGAYKDYKLPKDDIECVDVIQEYIDTLLDEGYLSMRWLNIVEENEATEDIVLTVGMMAELTRRYKAAGWPFVHFSDDGTSIRFP